MGDGCASELAVTYCLCPNVLKCSQSSVPGQYGARRVFWGPARAIGSEPPRRAEGYH